MKRIKIIVSLVLICTWVQTSAQDKKVWASGAARSVFQANELLVDNDTVTPKKLNSGHALVDLAINAKPNDHTFLHGMVRIRNDFGGFWGSGVSFDIRQLYVKGLIQEAVRYQLGDINYKLTPYTFFSNTEELSTQQLEGLNVFRQMVHYDLFYNEDNTWRQQGAAVDFALEFDEYVKELEVNLFASRNRPSDFAMQSDRVFFGGSALLTQSKTLSLGVNYIDLMDLQGTSRATTEFHNPVLTATSKISHTQNEWEVEFQSESGISEMYELNSSSARLRDFFVDGLFLIKHKKSGSELSLNYINVGPQFRSVGAQSKRLNFSTVNLLYSRFTNNQIVRPMSMLDANQDASLYQLEFKPELQAYSPAYDNIQPYGKATPNRKGLNTNLGHQDKKERYELNLGLQMLSEVVGQGGDDLRNFNRLNFQGQLNLDKLIKNYKKSLKLSLGHSMTSTSRTTSVEEGNVDLVANITDIGLSAALVSSFELLLNVRMLNAQGNELISLRNANTEVDFFEPYETDLNEQLLLIGLRYNFSETNSFNLIWQKIDWEDSKADSPKYSINQLAIVYLLTF